MEIETDEVKCVDQSVKQHQGLIEDGGQSQILCIKTSQVNQNKLFNSTTHSLWQGSLSLAPV